MRLILPITSSNPDLQPADPLTSLRRSSMLAGYDMTSRLDFSGNDKNMTYAGTFNSQGMVLDGTRENAALLPFNFTSEFSLIYCCNINSTAAGAPQLSFLNALNVSGESYTGFRILQQANNGGGFFFSQANTKTERVLNSTFSGAWTVQTVRVKQNDETSSTAQRVTHGLAITSLTGGDPAFKSAPSTDPICLGGIPTSVGYAGSITAGVTGTVGMILAYNEFLSDADAKSLMDSVASIMAGRGVTVP